MPRKTFQLNITGPQAPEDVPISELAEFLVQLERSVLALTSAGNFEIPSGEPAISLVDVRPGSEGLLFSVPAPFMPAVSMMSKSIQDRDLHRLPREAHRELFELTRSLRGRGWGLVFVADPLNDVAAAEITPLEGIAPPPAASEARGDTTLLARCLRVGGVKPKAEIRLRSGELLYPDVTEEIARQLGRRLYDEVVVKATVTWKTDDWSIVDLKVNSVSPYQKVDPVLAFRDLSEASHGRWDGVDAREYVEILRSQAG